jgi:hypothetical protein
VNIVIHLEAVHGNVIARPLGVAAVHHGRVLLPWWLTTSDRSIREWP